MTREEIASSASGIGNSADGIPRNFLPHHSAGPRSRLRVYVRDRRALEAGELSPSLSPVSIGQGAGRDAKVGTNNNNNAGRHSMASKATILQDTPGAVVVRVDHLDTDSFSRSVDPTATRALKRATNYYTVSRVTGSYAYDTNGRKCVSIIAFARSYAAAEELVIKHKITQAA